MLAGARSLFCYSFFSFEYVPLEIRKPCKKANKKHVFFAEVKPANIWSSKFPETRLKKNVFFLLFGTKYIVCFLLCSAVFLFNMCMCCNSYEVILITISLLGL